MVDRDRPHPTEIPPLSAVLPDIITTDTQQRIFDCALCQCARNNDGRAHKRGIAWCMEVGDPLTYVTLEKFVNAGLLIKEKSDKPLPYGETKVHYRPNPGAQVEPKLNPDCPSLLRPDSAETLIPTDFTPMQRQMLGCMACIFSGYSDESASLADITTSEVRACFGPKYAASINMTFKKAQEAGFIEAKAEQHDDIVMYRATGLGAILFSLLNQDQECRRRNRQDSLQPDLRAKVIRCIACLTLQRGDVDVPLTAHMIAACIGANTDAVAAGLMGLEREQLVRLMTLWPLGSVPDPDQSCLTFEQSEGFPDVAGAQKRTGCGTDLWDIVIAEERATNTRLNPDVYDIPQPEEVAAEATTNVPATGNVSETEELPVEKSAIQDWHIALIRKTYPRQDQERAIKYLELLLKSEMIKIVNIRTPVSTVQEARQYKMAVQNRTIHPDSGDYMTIGPRLSDFTHLEQQVVLHITGGDLFVLGRRLNVTHLKQMLDVDKPFVVHARELIAKALSKKLAKEQPDA